jgi:hypothetical protein
MTAPAMPSAEGRTAGQRRLRRRLALAAILTFIVITALLTPELTGGRTGDARLTTYSAQPQGARLLYELAQRLGWHVDRRTEGSALPADGRTVIAVLDPPQPLGAIEVHRLLEQVRAGSGLLYVMSGGSPMQDSLHVKRNFYDGTYGPTDAGTSDAAQPKAAAAARARRFDSTAADTTNEAAASAECAGKPTNGGGLPLWGDDAVHLYRLSWTRRRPSDAVIFARSATDSSQRDSTVDAPAAAGFALGRGRVVVLSDPDLLRNDVLRVCRWGLDVVAVRMLEYLAAGASPPRDRLVFDEYHQGFGAHPGTLRAIALYLSRASSGHVLLQCLLGGLVLLLALGPRALPAHDVERVERRSPLEHVSALARAYTRVGATRTATARLLRGVRRRAERGAQAGHLTDESDARFLETTVRMAPALAEDVELIRRALSTSVTRHEFESVGAALKHLEESLQTQAR